MTPSELPLVSYAQTCAAGERLTGRFGDPLDRATAHRGGTVIAAPSARLIDRVVQAAHAEPALREDIGLPEPTREDLLSALTLVEDMHFQAAASERHLLTAARSAGLSWQEIADAYGFASRQAAEQRYKRLGGGQ